MDSDFLAGGYSAKHGLEQLRNKLADLNGELTGAYENSRGRTHDEIHKEIAEIEEQIRLLENPPA